MQIELKREQLEGSCQGGCSSYQQAGMGEMGMGEMGDLIDDLKGYVPTSLWPSSTSILPWFVGGLFAFVVFKRVTS
jgi:hypothetical protein